MDNNTDTARREMKIACVLPPVIKGGGGHRTLLNNVDKLGKRYGSKPDLYVLPYQGCDSESTIKRIREYYGLSFEKVLFDYKIPDGYDIVIASSWDTVDIVASCSCDNKFYFVQDYEAWFFPMGTTRIKAEATYTKGLKHIVFGRWLSNKIADISGAPVFCVDFCADHSIYYPKNGAQQKENAICAIWQPDKPRRLHELLIEALQILEITNPELKVYLFGSKESLPIELVNVEMLGILSVNQCNELYNKCICGISLSGSNPSRIPFEMMTAGLPVIEMYRDNNIYDFPSEGMLLCEPNPESLAEAIINLSHNPEKCAAMSQAGLDYMKERLLENESKQFVDGIVECISKSNTNKNKFLPIYTKPVFTAKQKTIETGRQVKETQYSQIIQQIKQTIRAESIKFNYKCNKESILDRYQLAIWEEPDQSDLIWLKMHKTIDNCYECTWGVPKNLNMSAKYNIHLYKKDIKMNRVGCWEKTVQREDTAGTVTVVLSE